jgi:hypothetical protein
MHVVKVVLLSTTLLCPGKKVGIWEKTKRSGLSKTIVVYPNVFPPTHPRSSRQKAIFPQNEKGSKSSGKFVAEGEEVKV